MRLEILILALGMGLVTYLPRMLPAVLIDRLGFGPRIEKLLKLLPYTAMSALIFPGVFTVDAARPEIGIVGGLVAGLLAWRRVPVIACVLAAIAADMLLYLGGALKNDGFAP